MTRSDSPPPSYYDAPDDGPDPRVTCWNCGELNDRTETCKSCGVLLDEPQGDLQEDAHADDCDRDDYDEVTARRAR